MCSYDKSGFLFLGFILPLEALVGQVEKEGATTTLKNGYCMRAMVAIGGSDVQGRWKDVAEWIEDILMFVIRHLCLIFLCYCSPYFLVFFLAG